MTHVGPAPTSTPAARVSESAPAFVGWGAIIAGAFLASALSFVLLTFGAAIGLSVASPWPSSGLSAKLVAALAILWAMTQQIGAFLAGGYVAGRVRARWPDASQQDTEFRDGLHGALVWAVGVVIGAALLFATAGAATRTGAEAVGKAAAAAGFATDPMELAIDTMVRPAAPAQGPASQQAPGQAPGGRTAAGSGDGEIRSEISRILASSVSSGSLTRENRSYLAQLVARRTGLTQAEAEKRVNDAENAVRRAADNARRATVLTGFVTAAGLLISLAAAWWAAQKGGQHRDQSLPATFGFGRHRRQTIAG